MSLVFVFFFLLFIDSVLKFFCFILNLINLAVENLFTLLDIRILSLENLAKEALLATRLPINVPINLPNDILRHSVYNCYIPILKNIKIIRKNSLTLLPLKRKMKRKKTAVNRAKKILPVRLINAQRTTEFTGITIILKHFFCFYLLFYLYIYIYTYIYIYIYRERERDLRVEHCLVGKPVNALGDHLGEYWEIRLLSLRFQGIGESERI